MRVLIVEDDPFKRKSLQGELTRHITADLVVEAGSLQEAMLAVSEYEFDLVLLDMAIPSHSGGLGAADTYSQPVGGLDILMHLAFNDNRVAVIIMTQHPTVEYNREHIPLRDVQKALGADGVDIVVDVILFDEDGAWTEPFARALGEMA